MSKEEIEKLANEIAEKANECCYRDTLIHGSDGYEEDIRALALVALERAAGLLQWISIMDQEPPDGQSILITDGNVRAVAFWKERYSDGTYIWELEGIGGYEVETKWEDREITHWMPLPELPGKET